MVDDEGPAEQMIDKLGEELHHEASHSESRWTLGVALSSALLAALASIASLHSGHAVNSAMTFQIRASDHWAYYQAKSIKAAVLTTQIEILSALGRPPKEGSQAKLEEYRSDQEDLKKQAEELEADSGKEFKLHEVFSRGVTLFQVAIAIAAISVLTRRKRFWWVSLAFGMAGLVFLVQGMVSR